MRSRSIPLAFAISALLSLVAFSQTSTARPSAATQTAAAPGGGKGAQGKIVLIHTAACRVGIDELRVKLEALNKEFEPQNTELQGLQRQIEDLKNEVQAPNPKVQPSERNKWIEQGTE